MFPYAKQPDAEDTDNVNNNNTGINGACHHIIHGSLNFLMRKDIIYTPFKQCITGYDAHPEKPVWVPAGINH
jgi:hypothetical protein